MRHRTLALIATSIITIGGATSVALASPEQTPTPQCSTATNAAARAQSAYDTRFSQTRARAIALGINEDTITQAKQVLDNPSLNNRQKNDQLLAIGRSTNISIAAVNTGDLNLLYALVDARVALDAATGVRDASCAPGGTTTTPVPSDGSVKVVPNGAPETGSEAIWS